MPRNLLGKANHDSTVPGIIALLEFNAYKCISCNLTACAVTYDRLTSPTVDLRNVDPVKYNNDVADCTDKKREASFVGSARIITDCMKDRGYIIIDPKG